MSRVLAQASLVCVIPTAFACASVHAPQALKLTPTNVLPSSWGATYKATIVSTSLGETRTVDIFVPKSFKATKRKNPVIFLSDGEYNFEYAAVASYELEQSGHIPECIVAAIENPHRTQDLTPPSIGGRACRG